MEEQRCFLCGEPGHIRAQCPTATDSPAVYGDRSAWCGECDRQTRLIDHGDYMTRCSRCWAWPARGTYPKQELAQYKRCGGCGRRVYTWDAAPCGQHQNLAYTG